MKFGQHTTIKPKETRKQTTNIIYKRKQTTVIHENVISARTGRENYFEAQKPRDNQKTRT